MQNMCIAFSLWLTQTIWVALFVKCIQEGEYSAIPSVLMFSYGTFFAAIDYSERVLREIREGR